MGNWKMNHTIAEAIRFCEDVKNDSLLKIARSKGVLLGVAFGVSFGIPSSAIRLRLLH